MHEITEMSDEMLNEIASSLLIKATELQFIKYSQNFVYSFVDVNGVERILRITSNCHRTRDQIESEIEWISFLHHNGVNVCPAIPMSRDEVVKTISFQNDLLHCVVFKKATGKPVKNVELNKELYFMHGSSTGKLHRLAKQFKLTRGFKRFNWDENRLFTTDPVEYLPDGTKEALLELIPHLLAEANSIEKNIDSYGLIHFDLNYENFFVSEQALELYDFDNCSYGYFISDASKALYNSVFTYLRNKKGLFRKICGLIPAKEDPQVYDIAHI